MSETIIMIDTSEVQEDKLQELKETISELVGFVRAKESRPGAYNVYFSEDGRHMTVVQVHPDSASMEQHMSIAGPAFARFRDLLRLSAMDVYGRPSAALLQQLREKARMLGDVPVTVHEFHAGLERFATASHAGSASR
jgi:quinol monooxygenase YgiN